MSQPTSDEELREQIDAFILKFEGIDAEKDTLDCIMWAIEQRDKARDAAKEREVLGLPEDGKWYDISLQAKAGERVLIANYQRRESDQAKEES